ncbi:MAG: hypothetical protein WD099_10540, partial [Dongiaceae bacterium]
EDCNMFGHKRFPVRQDLATWRLGPNNGVGGCLKRFELLLDCPVDRSLGILTCTLHQFPHEPLDFFAFKFNVGHELRTPMVAHSRG